MNFATSFIRAAKSSTADNYGKYSHFSRNRFRVYGRPHRQLSRLEATVDSVQEELSRLRERVDQLERARAREGEFLDGLTRAGTSGETMNICAGFA